MTAPAGYRGQMRKMYRSKSNFWLRKEYVKAAQRPMRFRMLAIADVLAGRGHLATVPIR